MSPDCTICTRKSGKKRVAVSLEIVCRNYGIHKSHSSEDEINIFIVALRQAIAPKTSLIRRSISFAVSVLFNWPRIPALPCIRFPNLSIECLPTPLAVNEIIHRLLEAADCLLRFVQRNPTASFHQPFSV